MDGYVDEAHIIIKMLLNVVLMVLIFGFTSTVFALGKEGGGGHGVLCNIDGKETVELFDFFEVKRRYKFKIIERSKAWLFLKSST